MDERELRKQRRAIREAEIRMKLEREIKASTDFIFGVNQPERQAFGGGHRGQRHGGDRRVEANARIPPQNNQNINQGLEVNGAPSGDYEAFVACPICFFPTLFAKIETHIMSCTKELENSVQADGDKNGNTSDAKSVRESQVAVRNAVQTLALAQTRESLPHCIICWEAEREGDLRCPAGLHVICNECLIGLVSALAEQAPAQLGL